MRPVCGGKGGRGGGGGHREVLRGAVERGSELGAEAFGDGGMRGRVTRCEVHLVEHDGQLPCARPTPPRARAPWRSARDQKPSAAPHAERQALGF